MRLIAIDTAGPVVGVALWDDGRVARRVERVQRGAEARLAPWARELAAEAGFGLADLDGVAVAEGPGAFTGVRVGLATAAGLALAAGVPVWPCSSLRSRAERVRRGVPVLCALDARKGRLYAEAYDADGESVAGPGDVPPAVAVAWMTAPFLATGEGALLVADAVAAAGGEVAAGADDVAVEHLARLAAAGLSRGEGVDPVELRPRYLREPDATPPSRR
jgi:tRNA threonylcarbamoyladenosine biosynthesis protein TsaB